LGKDRKAGLSIKVNRTHVHEQVSSAFGARYLLEGSVGA